MTSNATYDDVERAAERLRDHAHRTPVMRSTLIDEMVGATVFFKCENFQRVGAFKFRGAFNALAKLTPQQRGAGVVAFSGGNHAQGVALAARILELPATIVMPSDAPASKLDATRDYGATVVLYDRATENREHIAAALAADRGATIIPSFDHPDVIAGQGTAAKELIEDVGALDALFVPVGGGGLLAGTLLTTDVLSPTTAVYGVEPELANDAQQSLRAGEIVHMAPPPTIADGANSPHIGKRPFEIIRSRVSDILTVTEDEIVEALKTYCTYMKLVVEPTGCLGLAAARSARDLIGGRRVGVMISGGNVDLDRLGSLLARSTASRHDRA